MTEPTRSSDTRQKVYLMEGERLAAPWIHNTVSRRDDEVGGDKRTCAPNRAPVAGRVDLADGTPGWVQLLNHLLSSLPNIPDCGSPADARTMARENATQKTPGVYSARSLGSREARLESHKGNTW